MIWQDAEIPPVGRPILAQRHAIPARWLVLHRGLKRQQSRPEVLAGTPIGESRTLAESVEHAIADSRPVETDGVGSALRAFDSRPRSSAVDLHPHAVFLKILLSPLAITALEVRGAALVQRHRPVGGGARATAASTPAAMGRSTCFVFFCHSIGFPCFQIYHRVGTCSRPCRRTKPGRSHLFLPLCGSSGTGRCGGPHDPTSEPARGPRRSPLGGVSR